MQPTLSTDVPLDILTFGTMPPLLYTVLCAVAAAELEGGGEDYHRMYKDLKSKYLEAQVEIRQLKLEKEVQAQKRAESARPPQADRAVADEAPAASRLGAQAPQRGPPSLEYFSHLLSKSSPSKSSPVNSRPSVSPMGGQPKCGGIFHLHLNKCGGTTIRNTFEKQARRTSDTNRWQVMPSGLLSPRPPFAACKAAQILLVHWLPVLLGAGVEGRTLHQQLVSSIDQFLKGELKMDSATYQRYQRDPSSLNTILNATDYRSKHPESWGQSVDPACFLTARSQPSQGGHLGTLPVPAAPHAVPELGRTRLYMEFHSHNWALYRAFVPLIPRLRTLYRSQGCTFTAFTVLREPRAQVLSAWNYWDRKPPGNFTLLRGALHHADTQTKQLMNGVNLASINTRPQYAERAEDRAPPPLQPPNARRVAGVPVVHNRQQSISMSTRAPPPRAWDDPKLTLKGWKDCSGAAQLGVLQAARLRLQDFDVVGLFERMDETLQRVGASSGFGGFGKLSFSARFDNQSTPQTTARAGIQSAHASYMSADQLLMDLEGRRLTIKTDMGAGAALSVLPASALELLANATMCDAALYAHGVQLFDEGSSRSSAGQNAET